MLEVKVNLLKNRLYITLGRVQKSQVKTSASIVEKEVRKLEPGFTCITRIIDARDIDRQDIEEIKKIQVLLNKLGMAKAVRVGVENGKRLLNRTGRETEYIVSDAATVEEAEQLLDNWVKENT